MPSLSGDHSKVNVEQELEEYTKLLSEGDYLIVEDSNIGGHPVYTSFGPGPYEAIAEFLSRNRSESFVRCVGVYEST